MFRAGAVDEIRDRLDLVELVREYVPSLKKAGRGFKACCPFHQERTPSFTVSQEKQLWYCFGACHDGGDVFKFVMKAENLSFPEAAQRLAERTGVQWRPAAESLGPRERERLRLRDALEYAKDWYREILLKAPEADGARKYLTERGVKRPGHELFELGFAPAAGHAFLDAALRRGFEPELLRKAGLLGEREAGRYYDYFRGRVLFPIRDARGAVVAFGGRAMGDAMPKYLNSPETPVFAKGRTLYGLHQAGPAIRKEGRAVLVEGYMDVLACHQAGVANAVAPLGTAVTPDHARSLKRYAEEVVMVFDPDAAGATAAARGAELLMEEGLFVTVGTVPDGKDPDEYLKANGREAFEASALKGAQDVAAFQTELALRRAPDRSIRTRVQVAQAVLPVLAKQPNKVLRMEWFRRLSGALGLSEEALREEEGKLGLRARSPRPGTAPARAVSKENTVLSAEEELIVLVLKHPELWERASGLDAGRFSSEACRKAWELIRGADKSAEGWPQALAARAGGEEGAWLSRFLLEKMEFASPADSLGSLLEALDRTTDVAVRHAELRKRVMQMADGAAPRDEAVIAEYKELEHRLRGTKRAPMKG